MGKKFNIAKQVLLAKVGREKMERNHKDEMESIAMLEDLREKGKKECHRLH